MSESDPPRPGPPPLRPFGLVLHHDGRWTHEGAPILNRKLRAAFDSAVRFLPDEREPDEREPIEGEPDQRAAEDREAEEGQGGKFVVQIAHFRGQIEVEEAAFFVRDFAADIGEIALSDRSREPLDVSSLSVSPLDGALLCRIKRDLAPDGLLARFRHAAQAELLNAVEDGESGPRLRMAGALHDLPDL